MPSRKIEMSRKPCDGRRIGSRRCEHPQANSSQTRRPSKFVTELLRFSGFYLTGVPNGCTLRVLFRCLTEIAKNRRSKAAGFFAKRRGSSIHLSPLTFYRRQ